MLNEDIESVVTNLQNAVKALQIANQQFEEAQNKLNKEKVPLKVIDGDKE